MKKITLVRHISGIGILRSQVILLVCLLCALRMSAVTDVTSKYLKNADFSSGPVVSVEILTYEKDVTGNAVFGLQDVNGWSKQIVIDVPNSPGSGMAGGVVAYGSTNTPAPATGFGGKTIGNCLCFWAVWTCGSYYYQDVTLPAGKYTLSIPVYNASGTKAYESHIGFIPDNGTPYVISGVPATGQWTTLTTSFILSEETKGRIALGYTSTGQGSSAAPHLFFDRVILESGEWEDCTSYIQNPGFDEDISFNVDGSATKAYVNSYDWTAEEKYSGTMHITADGSIYNEDKGGTQGVNAAGLPNWDGYKATIRGWETTNKYNEAMWIYYGCIPYNLGKGMMSLGGGTNGAGDVTEKPSEIATADNTGVLYLKAGWGNACTYKQTVRNLPKAKYRFSYYIRNTNVEKSSKYAAATNLCNVTCNGIVFADEEGFNSEGWIKHTIDFIPVDSFSVEFGCQASMDYSYNNPVLWIDGIELFKTGNATDDEVDAAYQELIVKAYNLVATMHFAADKRALQTAINAFEGSRDYVALYQALLRAEESESKYEEIMAEGALLHVVSTLLSDKTDDTYGGAKNIVQYAYTKTTEWIVSDIATYVDADERIARLDAYANTYAPAYKEAEAFANSDGGVRAERLRNLMASQTTALTESELKTPEVIQQYVEALRQIMGMKEQTLSLSKLPSMTYGAAAYTLPATTTEGLPLTWKSSNTAVATINSGKLTIKGVGTAKITATQAGNDNYIPFSREFTLTVAKAPLTIKANDCSKLVGEENPKLTVSYNGFVYGENNTVLTTQPTVSTTATKNSPAGTYPITVSGASASNYSITYSSGTLTVTEPDVATIVIGDNGAITYSNKRDLDFSGVAGIRAYIASGYYPETGNVLLTRVTEVPARTGIMVKGAPGTYKVPYSPTSAYYVNLLVDNVEPATVSPTEGDQTNLYLTMGNGGLGFYCVGTALYMEANSAYLQLPTSVFGTDGSRMVRIVYQDVTTGINEAATASSDVSVYDLSGRRVDSGRLSNGQQKGLNIVRMSDGTVRKIMVK